MSRGMFIFMKQNGCLDIPEATQSPIYQEHIRQGVEQAFYTA